MRIILLLLRVSLLFLACIMLPSQSLCASPTRETGNRRCFSLEPYDDAEKVVGPNAVRLYSKTRHLDVTLDMGRFCIPGELADSEFLDLSFQIGRDQFYLPSIPMGKFTGTWSFYFGGRRFAYLHGLPRSTPAAKSCVVEFNEGEPGTGSVISPCRFRGRNRR
jgi:hypothetical protein